MLKLVDPDRALDVVLENSVACAPVRIPLEKALYLTLAEDVFADRDYPPFDRAAVDGYAIRLVDAGRTVKVAGIVAAGQTSELQVTDGQAVEIMTGASCPQGTQAVVMKEQTRREGGCVELSGEVEEGQHVARAGSECSAGTKILDAGVRLTPLGIAVLASVGRFEPLVHARPSMGIIATGDELAAGGATPGPAQIRDSNGPMLCALARCARLDDVRPLRASDSLPSLAEALSLVSDCSIILLSGGVSAGRYDFVPQAVEAYGATPILHKVTQKPGKPLFVARRDSQLIFGLPGNPVSSHFCFSRYVAAALRVMMGRPGRRPSLEATLAAPLPARSDRTLFVPARADERRGERRVTPLLGRGSADLFAVHQANVYLRLEAGLHALRAGERVRFEWIGERDEL